MLAANTGDLGITDQELDAVSGPTIQAVASVWARGDSGELGFLQLPDDEHLAERIEAYAKAKSQTVADVLIIGIGGSSLGPKAITDALRTNRPTASPKAHYLENIDPDSIADVLATCDPRRTAVNVISKSGATVETLATYWVVRKWLRDAVGTAALDKHITVTTDPLKGFLRKMATTEGLPSFSVPDNVGGRFSVLTPVGLLPIAFAGVSPTRVLSGARWMANRCREADFYKNPAAIGAALHYLFDTRRQLRTSVHMIYSDALRTLGDWFLQLWAESLGKISPHGPVGPTPIRAVGASDQHSQLQLYMEGPPDKHFWFFEVERFSSTVTIPDEPVGANEVDYLCGSNLTELIHAERRATSLALAAAGRPNATYSISELSPESLGALLFLFEIQTAIAGKLYAVNAFDQPGVEAGKRLTYALMHRPGFDAERLRVLSTEEQIVRREV